MVVSPNKKLKATIYKEPSSEVFNWTLEMCKEWLREHKLEYTGRVNDLRETITEYKFG